MKLKSKIIIYIIFAIAIGVACFNSVVIFVFNYGDGFLSNNNNPLAISVAIFTITGVALFLIIGYVIFRNKDIIIAALFIIIGTSFLTMPVGEVIYNIIDFGRQHYR